MLQRLGIANLRVYAQGANLFTLTKYTGLDPELGGSSSSFGLDCMVHYPDNELSVIFGINLYILELLINNLKTKVMKINYKLISSRMPIILGFVILLWRVSWKSDLTDP